MNNIKNSDLESYSRVQLRDIAENINRDAYPERYAKIQEILTRPPNEPPPEETEEEIRERKNFDSWMEWISVEIMIWLFIGLLMLLGFWVF